jgi:hypothetical protein
VPDLAISWSISIVHNRLPHVHTIQLRVPLQPNPVIGQERRKVRNPFPFLKLPPQDHRPLLGNIVDNVTLAEPRVVICKLIGCGEVLDANELGTAEVARFDALRVECGFGRALEEVGLEV